MALRHSYVIVLYMSVASVLALMVNVLTPMQGLLHCYVSCAGTASVAMLLERALG